MATHTRSKFRININGSFYSYELYNDKGEEIFTLDAAIEAAREQYPDDLWEVWNGEEAYSNYEET